MKLNVIDPVMRRILINQLLLLLSVDSSVHQKEEYDRQIHILVCGYVNHYSELDIPTEVFTDDPFVIDVLCMYDLLEFSYSTWSEGDQQKLVKYVRFHGFDGNNEIEHYMYAKWIFGAGKFSRVATRAEDYDKDHFKMSFNSHEPMISAYNVLLRRLAPIKERRQKKTTSIELRPIPLTPNDVRELFNVK